MTQVSQPLDVSTFSHLEKRIQLLSHCLHSDPTNAGRKLDQYSMMKIVVYEAVQQVFSKWETVISGFRRTGLVPWRKLDPEHLKKFLTSALCQRLPLLVIKNLFLQLPLILPWPQMMFWTLRLFHFRTLSAVLPLNLLCHPLLCSPRLHPTLLHPPLIHAPPHLPISLLQKW